MSNIIYTKEFLAPPIDRREAQRYAGASTENEESARILDECIDIAKNSFVYKVCYREFAICEDSGMLDLGFCSIKSETLKKNLLGCERIILFAATVGFEIDRLVARYLPLSPAKAAMLDALGSERVEALCDAFAGEVKKDAKERGFISRPRVSAGYGDIPLSMQRDMFAFLDCNRKIGISLGENLLMSPSKSVTAIIGLQEKI